MPSTQLARLLMIAGIVLLGRSACASDPFELPPIEYSTAAPANAISRLQQRIEEGELSLDYDDRLGFLPSLLKALEIPVESQTLVFSKTSLQRHRISPTTPRAVYFNDDVYVGFCQQGDVLEVSVADPRLGAVFYTLDQTTSDKPQFLRETHRCLLCHGSSRTDHVPGHLVRSLFVDAQGMPIFSAGSTSVDHTTPFEKRWGGWYVTGTHGDQKHVGNLVVRDRRNPHEIDNAEGQNKTDLQDQANLQAYLSPHSDIVALMVLEHQTLAHNVLTQANFSARQALHSEEAMNRALGNAEGERLESTTRRISNAANRIVDAFLFVDEATLTAPIRGTSGYADHFESRGPHDRQGRSLRQFDLQTRMFRYPCSYLIYSESFDALPAELRDGVYDRLGEVLRGDNSSEKYAHLSNEDRQAIVEILRETKPNLPDAWN
jgi:hypothetical protein